MHNPSRVWNPNDLPVLFSEHIEPEPPPSPVRRRQNRAILLDESVSARFTRVCRALTNHVVGKNWLSLLRLGERVVRGRTAQIHDLPDPEQALRAPDGFCALAENLSPGVIMDVYARGINLDSGLSTASFWAPAQREVVDLGRFEPSHPGVSFRFSIDTDFDIVLACANAARHLPQSAKLLHAFAELADAGFAHSLEMRDVNGALVGGVFGIATGRVFVVHGCFARGALEREALLAELFALLKARTFVLADLTPLGLLGHPAAELMARTEFSTIVCDNLAGLRIGRWTQNADDDVTFAKTAA